MNSYNKRVIHDKEMKLIYQDYIKLVNTDQMSWIEFANYVNSKYDLDFTESAYRKRIQMFHNGTRLIALSDDRDLRDYVNSLNEIRIENKKRNVQNQLKVLRKEKQEFFANNEILEFISTFIAPSYRIPEIIIPKENSISNIFVISDLQCDGNGWCEKVVEFTYLKIKETIEKEKLEHIYLFLNGDEIDNLLRVTFLIENKSFVEQINEVQSALAKLLERLSLITKVSFSMVNSNHNEMRLLGVGSGDTKKWDITILLLNYLKAYLRNNNNIEWLNKSDKPTDLNYNIINVQGYNFFQQHGDLKGVNINNSEQTFDKIYRYYDDIDYCLFGHRHHLSIKSVGLNPKGGNKMVIWVPALDLRMKKENEQSLLLSSSPSFTRIIVEKGCGVKTIENIFVPKEMWVI